MNKRLIRCFLLIIAVGLVLSCRTTGPVVPIGPGNLGGKPAWIGDYPVDPAFYIGVGSSKTGNEAEDMDAARTRAIASLAASISTQIQSETVVSARENTAGESAQDVEQVVRETVNQHLREIEIVDTYYSAEDGYWFFVRLNKAAWAAIQQEEMGRLKSRVTAAVEPDLLDPQISISAKLRSLWKGWELIVSSSYAGMLEGDLLGRNGLLIDTIEDLVASYLDGLSVRTSQEEVAAVPGRPVSLEIAIRSPESSPPGRLPLVVTSEKRRAGITTEADGVFSGDIELAGLPMGTSVLTVSLDVDALGIDVSRMVKRVYPPAKELIVNVEQIQAGLTVVEPEDNEVAGLTGTVSSLVTSLVPVSFGDAANPEYELTAEVFFRNAPANEYGIIVVYSKIQFSVQKNNLLVKTYETEEAKDGGLSLSQAQERSFAKLSEAVETNDELRRVLKSSFE